jgi:hypothetical protein
MAVTVLDPEVKVAPLTVILKPEPALVEAAICDVAVDVAVGENNEVKLTEPAVAVVQSGTPLVVPIVAPAQKTRDSGITPFSRICVAVLAATLPVSIAEPVVSVDENVEILT